MEHFDHPTHDLKTERPDISPGLPDVLKLLPVVFYLALLGSGYLAFTYIMDYGKLSDEKKEWLEVTTDQEQLQETLAQETAAVEGENDRAADVVKWIDGARGIQPLGVAIARSAHLDSTIAEVSFERNPEIPSQILFTLVLNDGEADHLDATLSSISDLQYKPYSVNQVKKGSELDYQATLIWQGDLQDPN